MKTLMVVLTGALMAFFAGQTLAHDYTFEEPNWGYDLTDPPRWHYENDNAWTNVDYPHSFLHYVKLELTLSENTLVADNVIHMWVLIQVYNDEGPQSVSDFFDIGPNVYYLEVQTEVDLAFWVHTLEYQMSEMNTVPEGGGYIVIDEENSWIDRYYDSEVEPESLGEVKALFN